MVPVSVGLLLVLLVQVERRPAHCHVGGSVERFPPLRKEKRIKSRSVQGPKSSEFLSRRPVYRAEWVAYLEARSHSLGPAPPLRTAARSALGPGHEHQTHLFDVRLGVEVAEQHDEGHHVHHQCVLHPHGEVAAGADAVDA